MVYSVSLHDVDPVWKCIADNLSIQNNLCGVHLTYFAMWMLLTQRFKLCAKPFPGIHNVRRKVFIYAVGSTF